MKSGKIFLFSILTDQKTFFPDWKITINTFQEDSVGTLKKIKFSYSYVDLCAHRQFKRFRFYVWTSLAYCGRGKRL